MLLTISCSHTNVPAIKEGLPLSNALYLILLKLLLDKVVPHSIYEVYQIVVKYICIVMRGGLPL